MTTKKKTVKDKPMISEKSLAEQIGYFTMVVEGMRYDMKSFGEQLAATRVEFNDKLDLFYKELKTEIHFTQQAVRANSQEIKKVDQRLERVENKLDKVVEKVEHHDEEIVFIKTTIAKEA